MVARPLAGLCVLILVVGAGCSAEDPGDAATELPPDTGEELADTGGDGGFDYDEYLEVLQGATGLDDPPETQLVRLIAPEEQPDVWRDCMHEAGFEVTTTFDGGLSSPEELPDEQWDAYDLANYTCHAQFPVDQTAHQQFGEEQVEIVYAYYTDELVPCLEERGYDISPAPTFETFRASWIGGAGLHASEESWFPYESVDLETLGYEEWEELNLACPQNPSTEALFAGED